MAATEPYAWEVCSASAHFPQSSGLIATATAKNCPSVLSPPRGQLVIYRGVEYSVTATSEPEVWQWRFQIGDRTTIGKTRTRLIHMATRRVHMRIDATLRALIPAEHAES